MEENQNIPLWTLGVAPENGTLPIVQGQTISINEHFNGEEITIAVIPGNRMDEARVMCSAPQMLSSLNEALKCMPTLAILINNIPDERMKEKGLKMIGALTDELSKTAEKL